MKITHSWLQASIEAALDTALPAPNGGVRPSHHSVDAATVDPR